MCGIVGILNSSSLKNNSIDILKKLEYRGYDSAGISLFSKERIKTIKSVGKISELKNRNVIFDGFPRTQSQAEALDTFLASKNMEISGMVALEVSENVLVKRLLERGKTSGRADDTDEVKIRNRFNEYNTKTAVLKDYYAAKGCYHGVNGEGSIKEITNLLTKVLDTL